MDLEIDRVLDQYRVRSRKEDKTKEETYSEKRSFEAAKTIEKASAQTKELEFGGRIGMYIKSSNNQKLLSTSFYSTHCHGQRSFFLIMTIHLMQLHFTYGGDVRSHSGFSCDLLSNKQNNHSRLHLGFEYSELLE